MPETLTPDPEILARDHPDTLALRAPSVPTSLNELAALKGEAIEIVEARALVLGTLRTASIKATSPEDWLLFKAPDEQGGQIVGYLQDCGCDRVRDLWGIEIYGVGAPQKVTGAEPGIFHYLIAGDGRCKITRQVIEAIEGGRSSTDDFCKGKAGVELELLVRKAARANLDGNITRELAGMKSVPLDELRAAWTGSSKKIENCRRGRGFGTAAERLGANKESAPDVEPPVCPHCGTKGAYRQAKGDRGAFYGCPQYAKHSDKKWIVDAAKWIAEHQSKVFGSSEANHTTETAAKGSTKTSAASKPLTSGDIPFGGGGREPGEDDR